MPYIGVGTVYKIEKFSIEPIIKLSPYVILRDEDDHILRDKTSKGKLKGYAVMLSLEGRYDFVEHMFSTVSLSYRWVKADGDQDQSIGGSSLGKIEQEIESNHFIGMLTFGASFH